ncbi:MAG TPA: peptidylprolyl isomerase [Solirubrobacteraceae bacterium]|nr:peptidylprolyl isomerase [Solirubrobacteraceae bacterium]
MRKLAVILALAIVVVGCGSSISHRTTTHASQPTSGPCRTVAVPSPKGPQHLTAPALKLDPRTTYTVTVATNCGSFAFTLDVAQSPKTSASFYALVRRGFFDGLTFHRVAAGFVIQGGDPNGDGSGGPGYTVVEPPPASTQYVRGDVAMAKTQTDPPGASGSQFFIVTAANATQADGLTPDYALLGKVVSGMNVVQAIDSLPTNPAGDGAPTPPVVMSKVTVTAS